MTMAVELESSYLERAFQKAGAKLSQTNVILPPTPPDTDIYSRYSESSPEAKSHVSAVSFPLPPPSNSSALTVLPEDKKTPDNHVGRDPRLIRLTGIHPFNVEAPLSDLFNEGFLTPPELFYVRNHGAVPQVHDEEISDWEFSVEGHVKKPFKLTLGELIEQYERSGRGLFSGSIGYISPKGDFDLNVIIRSLFYSATGKYLSYKTGGAITYDSVAEQEWEEMRLKAWALERIFSGEK